MWLYWASVIIWCKFIKCQRLLIPKIELLNGYEWTLSLDNNRIRFTLYNKCYLLWICCPTFCSSNDVNWIWAYLYICLDNVYFKLRSSFCKREYWCRRSTLIYFMWLNRTPGIYCCEVIKSISCRALSYIIILSWYSCRLYCDWVWSTG
jgi:hypothetical protein